jgi:hypothetical protein
MTEPCTDSIPPPAAVRRQLAETLRAAAVLRRQLRVSEAAARTRTPYSRQSHRRGGQRHA